jgi:phosphomannomutase / phosphoglucomutase
MRKPTDVPIRENSMQDNWRSAAVKDCDIRGRYPEEVNEDLFLHFGKAFGRQVTAAAHGERGKATVIVGCDDRPSTPALKKSFLTGLTAYDLRITDLGVVPTPVVYWAKERLEAQASAIITASHNPSEFNGLKVMNGKRPPTSDMLRALAEEEDRNDIAFLSGQGCFTPWPEALAAYKSEMIERFAGHGIESLSIVLDPGTGCQSGVASEVFRELGAKVAALHDHLDGTYPERHPDCAIPEHLAPLMSAVRKFGADLGVAFDGDGDRIAVVDDQGRIIASEHLGMILLEGPLRPDPGMPVIIDLKCSMHLDRLVSHLQGRPVRCKSGHAYMKDMVLELGAIMGIELSGHIFLKGLKGRDDPLYTALILSEYLASQTHSLSSLVSRLPRLIMTKDLRIPMSGEEMEQILEGLKHGLEGARMEMLDGVRLIWDHGWLLARKSITEPKITLRWEGETATDLKRIGRLLADRFHGLSPYVEKALREERNINA